MSSSDVKRASARQQGQILGHEIQSHAKEVRVASVTSVRSHRPQVVRLQTKGVLMGLSRAYFSLLNNIWSIALLYGAGKIASFLP
jgi:predicted signal transduction protein with EAL and GGDEF domain